MEPKTSQESEIYSQITAMLADQFSHQSGNNITINRMVLADMLTKQTMHGIELGESVNDTFDVLTSGSGAFSPTTRLTN